MFSRWIVGLKDIVAWIEASSHSTLTLMMLALAVIFGVGAFVLPDQVKALAVIWAIFP